MKELLSWYAKHGRDLPWRHTTDPYKILVSEIMLQQTQVDRVIPKYNAWLKEFPSWSALASGSRANVLKLWSGLGYNSRAIRLHALAQIVVQDFGGVLPTTEDELVRLPGIGPYTAGAIMVFAHNKPGKCVDVNIERIVKRFCFHKNKKITHNEVIQEFLGLFPVNNATALGNALMDFGSMICTASKPRCSECPLFTDCKSKGERPEEQEARVKKRQPKFEGSNRWWRGQILKAVNQGVNTRQDLLKAIDADDEQAFDAALAQLCAEGLLSGSRRISIRE